MSVEGMGGDYMITIFPLLNEELYDFGRIGLTLRQGNTVYNSAEYFESAPGYSIGCNSPGEYSLDVEVNFTNKITGVSDSVLITEAVSVLPGPPEVKIEPKDNSDGSVSFKAYIDEGDYAGQIQSVSAYVSDFTSDPVNISVTNSEPLVFIGTVPAELLESMDSALLTVKVIYGSDLAYVEQSAWI